MKVDMRFERPNEAIFGGVLTKSGIEVIIYDKIKNAVSPNLVINAYKARLFVSTTEKMWEHESEIGQIYIAGKSYKMYRLASYIGGERLYEVIFVTEN